MNEELTNEALEAMAKCGLDCARCVSEFCNKYDWQDIVQTLATALLEERARPKVWDGVPDEADYVTVGAYKNEGPLVPIKVKCYTRELPKSRARQIAEEIVDEINIWPRRVPFLKPTVETVLRVLNKYADELERKE